MDGVPLQLLSSAGGPAIAWGLVAAFVWMIMTGRLVPKVFHEETVKQRDAWQRMAETEQDKNTRISLPTAEVARTVFRAIPQQQPSSEEQG